MKKETTLDKDALQDSFTGGDWQWKQTRWNNNFEHHVYSGMITIANLDGETPSEVKANAALIAAAPDMYKALQEFLKIINRSETALHHYGDAIKKAEAALQKANPKQ